MYAIRSYYESPGKGTGLGLFVTRGIVERLGGKLYVASQVGQGTTFSITLPCRYELRENGITTYENSDIFRITSYNVCYTKLLRTRNIILIIIVVSFTPMIMISSFILHQFRVSYERKLNDHLAELVLKHKQSIDSFLKEKLSNIKSLSAIFSYNFV